MQKSKDKTISFTVINDLNYDRRMHRICSSLVEDGYQIELIGRELKSSKPLQKQIFKQTRLKCFVNKGPFFYVEYNIRLFFYLLFHSKNVFGAVDLDTILPNYLVSKVLGRPLVYDAHEYFTEVIEVQNRPKVKAIWQKIEKFCLKQPIQAYTVSGAYAKLYKDFYGIDFQVIKNVPLKLEFDKEYKFETFTFVYVGAVNAGRGLEECLQAIEGLNAHLRICGDGDVLEELKNNLSETQKYQVHFTGYLTPIELEKEIRKCHVGLLILKEESLSYKFSLANKFFDYVHAEVPQITIDFPEYERLNKDFEVALLTDIRIENIRNAMIELMNDNDKYSYLQNQTRLAKEKWNWQEEEKDLKNFYRQLL